MSFVHISRPAPHHCVEQGITVEQGALHNSCLNCVMLLVQLRGEEQGSGVGKIASQNCTKTKNRCTLYDSEAVKIVSMDAECALC
jgi:hypothetical protein